MKTFLLILLVVVCISTSDESLLKSCPEVNVIKSFDVNKFLGVWYQFAISGDLFKNPCEKSVTLDWAMNADGKIITITTYRFCSKGMICRRKQTIWKAELGDPDEKTGQVDGTLRLTVNRPDLAKTRFDLLILNTDYVHSAVLYTCSITNNRSMAIWILTRKQKHTDLEMADILTTVDATLETNHLDQFEFRLSNPKCESVVKNNSKAGKQGVEEPAVAKQNLTTNTSTTLPTNVVDKPGIESNNSKDITSAGDENISTRNTTLASSEVNHNNTSTLEQNPNSPSPTSESLLPDERRKHNSFNNITGLNRTLNRADENLSSSTTQKTEQNVHIPVQENLLYQRPINDSSTLNTLNTSVNNADKFSGKNEKGKHFNTSGDKLPNKKDKGKNVLYSVLANLNPQKPINNNITNNRPSKLPSSDEKLSRQIRNGKPSKHKPGSFEPEQYAANSQRYNSHKENPQQGSSSYEQFSGADYGGHNSPSMTKELQPQDAPEAGYFPSLVPHAFLKYIPRPSFNFHLWHM